SLVNKPTLNSDDCKLPLARRRPCLTDWIGYQMKCFYFSDKEETWSASQDFCSLYNASLAVIEKEEMSDLMFTICSVQRLLCSVTKAALPTGLASNETQNNPGNGWEVLGDGGDCAFLNDEGGASCSRCLNLHHWICSKPDEFTRPKIV
ncbi:hypothetical protein E2320_014654, partial [Naja naja]